MGPFGGGKARGLLLMVVASPRSGPRLTLAVAARDSDATDATALRAQDKLRRMELADLVRFMRQSTLAVQASVTAGGAPQAAVVGFVVSDRGELFFDTSSASRKCQNLRRDPRIALVVGWDERTVQYEGIADEPTGVELARLKSLYFERFPDGRERERWPDIAYFRVRPRWARFSDFTGATPSLQVLEFPALPG